MKLQCESGLLPQSVLTQNNISWTSKELLFFFFYQLLSVLTQYSYDLVDHHVFMLLKLKIVILLWAVSNPRVERIMIQNQKVLPFAICMALGRLFSLLKSVKKE